MQNADVVDHMHMHMNAKRKSRFLVQIRRVGELEAWSTTGSTRYDRSTSGVLNTTHTPFQVLLPPVVGRWLNA